MNVSAAGTTAGVPLWPLVTAFGFAYFLSALLRAVTATLAPVFGAELGLRSGDLGLLAGAYFLGFAAMQLPLGRALDRIGPKRVLLGLLGFAVVGCVAFALARSLAALVAARLVIGIGVAACLMAPLTCYRRLTDTGTQLRLNSWMLMTGSLGMLASTLPVQWLLPLTGWRGLFVATAGALVAAMLLLARLVPADRPPPAGAGGGGYREIARHPMFVRLAPMGFFSYAGLIAVQSLWAGPWLTQVAGHSAADAAEGLFLVNLCMLCAFFGWGAVMPRMARAGVGALTLIAWGAPLGLLWLGAVVLLGPAAGAWHWALWCVLTTVVALAQPAVGQAFAPALAGRALSAFNLVLFAGVFALQWGIGLAIDAFVRLGLDRVQSFQAAMAGFAACALAAYLWFVAGLRRMPIIGADGSRQ